MIAIARLNSPNLFSSSFSVANRRLRNPWSQEMVRSTTHRNRPNLLRCGAPRLARCGTIPRARNCPRCRSNCMLGPLQFPWSVDRAALGELRTSGIDQGASSFTSWTLAAVVMPATGSLLDAAGLNQEAAANVLGVNQATVCRWLNDSVPISAEKAALIRDRIGSRKK